MFRIIRRELEQTVHGEIVAPVRLNRAVVVPVAVLLTRGYWRA